MNNRSADYGHLTTMAFRLICQRLGVDPTGWSVPNIRADVGTYKIDWYAPDPSEDAITLYEDGVYQFYGKETKEGKIIPLHYKSWIRKLIAAGVHGGVAKFAVEFFKDLKK
jgi:hypothetical protein